MDIHITTIIIIIIIIITIIIITIVLKKKTLNGSYIEIKLKEFPNSLRLEVDTKEVRKFSLMNY